jgi:MoaA/NifB/PqqE/SkfB family radical SAM enzyme
MVLYRGPLSSCNYGCDYCPFAKRQENEAELAADRAALKRFVGWVAARPADRISALFTPWGEALVRSWYPAALARPAAMPHVGRAAIQTNLAGRLDWIARVGVCRVEPPRTGGVSRGISVGLGEIACVLRRRFTSRRAR